jgi:hypothetical protein
MLLIPLLVVPPAGAAPAPAPTPARAAASVVTTYSCDSDFGPTSGAVRISTKLPQSVRASRKLKPRVVRVSLTIPEAQVDQLRSYDVRWIQGASDSAKLLVGKKRLRVPDLVIRRTPVPEAGSMTLKGRGTLGSFSIKRAGSYPVRAPRRLPADLTAKVGDFQAGTGLTCAVVPGSPRRLTKLLVTN